MIKPNKILFTATISLLSTLLFNNCSRNNKPILELKISPDSPFDEAQIKDRNADRFEINETHSAHMYNEGKTFGPDANKKNPVITCPNDLNITCAADYTNLDIVGEASAVSSNVSLPVEYTDLITKLSVCNEGYIIRRWSVVGVPKVFCDQIITIASLGTIASVSFEEVGDIDISHCPVQEDLGEPTWVAGPCDVLGYTLETDTFYFEDGACYKLVNSYTVINWCDYKPNSPYWVETDDFTDGLATHTQIVRMLDQTKPVISDCEDFIFAINDHDDIDNDGNVCEAKIVLTNIATDLESKNCPSGWLHWQVFVDLWGDGTDDLEYSSFLPPFDSQFNDTNGNGIPDVYVPPTESGEEISITLPDLEGSFSLHRVRWKVVDGCNNNTTCNYDVQVMDTKAPMPMCIDTTTVELDMYGPPTLYAVDLDLGSSDNCSSEENLRYTFSDTPPKDDPSYDGSKRSSYRIFTLSDASNSPLKVNMYVWDEKDNYDFCVVNVIVDFINSTVLKTRPDKINGQSEYALIRDALTYPVSKNKLYQNKPNPFKDFTIIGFDLASYTNLTLTIFDSRGAIITQIDIEGKQGYNTYQIDRNELGMDGLYYYKLECEEFMDVKKMIILK